MEILRHPEVFAAASSSSPPTDWRNYDTIYTERYMWIPQENKEGYDKGSAMTYADNLSGRLMLYYRHGRQQRAPVQHDAADPGAAARRARASTCRSGRIRDTRASTSQRMMEFFIENLVLNPMQPKADAWHPCRAILTSMSPHAR